MGEASGIEWTDATFNPWIGCTKISPACDNCYAESWAERFGEDVWGKSPRRRTSEKNWNNPRRWQRKADEWEAEHGRPRFVFCASLADVFDNQVDPLWREDLWKLIKECDRLVWLLLSKRPQNIAKMLPADWGDGYPNVWLGTTVENQEIASRNIMELIQIPAAKRFLSIEPIVGPIDLWALQIKGSERTFQAFDGCNSKGVFVTDQLCPVIDWVITGGESGANARPAHPDWYRQLRDQCIEAGVPFHFKQWGEWIPYLDRDNDDPDWRADYTKYTVDPKFSMINLEGGVGFHGDRLIVSKRIGKRYTGRHIDGRTWDERPAP